MKVSNPPTTEQMTILLKNRDPEFGVAVAVEIETGEKLDDIGNWQTAISMAQEHQIVVLTGDGHLSRSELQQACDNERAMYLDCFGGA